MVQKTMEAKSNNLVVAPTTRHDPKHSIFVSVSISNGFSFSSVTIVGINISGLPAARSTTMNTLLNNAKAVEWQPL